MEFMGYKPLEQDYRFWMVVNPGTWLIPILMVVLGIALLVHMYAFSLPGQGFSAKAEAAPVVEAAPAVEAAPVAAPAQ
ncbi:light-harvesting antenna LH1, alpha subunit [Thiocystis violascens]|uniref:Antenna complex alpha/beta subunit domain-containing protein n=1 Tax=Thiocystis violascens (strain ATCC 17096 / DSM 198 / 6111) TaxID=765911 RepID=I3Y5S6_THIV6|nr:light-harvesting antenna LH1, alpha subunit [Thiocystis violascens]AFL72344.1 hypothetical protein Thivi_0275 [Thiocystis violascens DSM 198]